MSGKVWEYSNDIQKVIQALNFLVFSLSNPHFGRGGMSLKAEMHCIRNTYCNWRGSSRGKIFVDSLGRKGGLTNKLHITML